MKKILLLSILLLPLISKADGWCAGPVVRVMADNSNCTDSSGNIQLAYVLNSVSNRWLCARSSAGSSTILAAKMANKHVKAWVTIGNNCSQYNDYDSAAYIWIDED